MTVASFRAHKNGTNQTIVDQAWTQLTFSTEAFDNGNYFASDTWTPAAGKVRIMGNVYCTATTMTDTGLTNIAVKKNGSFFQQGTMYTQSGVGVGGPVNVVVDDDANGTDAYTLWAILDSATGTPTADGSSANTWFAGHQWPGSFVGFKANKNGVNQSATGGDVSDQVTFTTEVYDIGSYYNNSTSAWTPPTGYVSIILNLCFTATSLPALTPIRANIYKNGSALTGAESFAVSGANNIALLSFSWDDHANGTDVYTAQGSFHTGTSPVYSGDITLSTFSGVWISP